MPKARHILSAEGRFHGAGQPLLIWFNDCPKTLCDVIAVRLLPIAVLQPILSHLLSVSCHLITPYVRPFSFQNDGAVVTRARAIVTRARAIETWSVQPC
jgi:hypothetical protein